MNWRREVLRFFRKLHDFLLKQDGFFVKVHRFFRRPQRRLALGGNCVCKALNFPSVMRSKVRGTYMFV